MRPVNALAGGLPQDFDRSAHWRRDPNALAQARRDSTARVILVWRSKSLVLRGDSPRAVRLPVPAVEKLVNSSSPTPLEELWFLGVDLQSSATDRSQVARPVFALDVSAAEENDVLAACQTAGTVEFTDLRQVAALLPHRDGNLLAYTRALATWHRNHAHCSRCGGATTVESAGHLRRCDQCSKEMFPRTDPAVIMLVHDGNDRCLLGRQAGWPAGMFSTLAGFVEPGESLEMAVGREVLEETGAVVTSADYHSSQPWPFPTSIMLGFFAQAEYREGQLALDDELEQARWFELAELSQLLSTKELRLPAPMSISRRLIDDWILQRAAER